MERKNKMGTGQRAEKIRTYMLKYNTIIDHRTGEKFNLTNWMRGKWN